MEGSRKILWKDEGGEGMFTGILLGQGIALWYILPLIFTDHDSDIFIFPEPSCKLGILEIIFILPEPLPFFYPTCCPT